MKKIIGLLLLIVLGIGSLSAVNPPEIIIEELVVEGYVTLQARDVDDSGNIVVIMAHRGIYGETMHSIIYDRDKETVEEIGYVDVLENDAWRVTGISGDGKQATGFGKGTGDVFTYQIGVGITIYDNPYDTRWKYARSMAINKAKAIVGYFERQVGDEQVVRAGMWKKGSPSTDIEYYIHPDAYQVTEFISIDVNGNALGTTDTGYVFSFNINTEVMTNIETPPPQPSMANPNEVNQLVTYVPVPGTTHPPIIATDDDMKGDVNNFGEYLYTYVDPVSGTHKGIIWDLNTYSYQAIIVPGKEDKNMYMNGQNSTGNFVGYCNDGTSFIGTIVYDVPIESVPYDNIRYWKHTESIYIGLTVVPEEFKLSDPLDEVPITITVEMGGVTGEGSVVKYSWSGMAETYVNNWFIDFYLKED